MTGTIEELLEEFNNLCSKFNEQNVKYTIVLNFPDGVIKAYSSETISQANLTVLRNTFFELYTRSHSRAIDTTAEEEDGGCPWGRLIIENPIQLNCKNEDNVRSHLRRCLVELQQVPCKVIAKAWIKTIEPKKQTSHPYKLAEASKPPWWPRTVRHVEPDHLLKGERLDLMIHILMDPPVDVSHLWRALVTTKLPDQLIKLMEEMLYVARAVQNKSVDVVEVSRFRKNWKRNINSTIIEEDCSPTETVHPGQLICGYQSHIDPSQIFTTEE